MARVRPRHLRDRRITGQAFGERATLIRTATARNSYGESTETEASGVDVACATAPVEAGTPRARAITEGGIRLDATRLFWLLDAVEPVGNASAGDLIVYGGERYRVSESQPWGHFWEVLGVRQEGQ